MTVVVIDTNLIIAGRWRRGSSSDRIIGWVIEGRLDAVYTTETKNENLYILGKVKAPKLYMDRILKFYRVSRKVDSGERINACPDKSDNRFLEAAVSGKAGYVITSDSDLLDMREYEGIRILKPGAFEREVSLH
ncbi:MAG: putative toxin-antitoxin system toxin component, PIN family [Candidatus Altiarchaeota archaeon]|nr:putative toxin-antitoxin system toxin component, PIN family [Candidatus Altiarchaeota archaeon]